MSRPQSRRGPGFGEHRRNAARSPRSQMSFDRHWFEGHREHQVWLRWPDPFEVEDCRAKTGPAPSLVLVYPLAEGARYRVFGRAEDILEVERYVLGHRPTDQWTVAEFLPSRKLPCGSHLEYSLRPAEAEERVS